MGAERVPIGCGWWLWRATAPQDYAAAFLPGLLIAGTAPSVAVEASAP